MKDKLVRWVLKRINWGALLPKALGMVAEGKLGGVPQKIYWALAGKKTFIGIAGAFIAAGAAGVCGQYDLPWACHLSNGAVWLFGILAAVGLVDGGKRSPLPGTAPPARPPA